MKKRKQPPKQKKPSGDIPPSAVSTERPADRFFQHWPLILVILVATILLISNLGNHYLWDDEAQTALISRTVLHSGIPLGSDGKNSFSAESGREFGENHVYKWHTWLPFYVTAGFFGMFGVSTFVARLPFALFAVATVILTYFFTYSLCRNRRVSLIAAALLTLSVPFLLLSRQCRYYSPAMFFSLLALYGYLNVLDRKRFSAAAFLAASVLLFQSQHVVWIALMAAITIHVLLCYRDQWRRVVLLSAGATAIHVPWMIWIYPVFADFSRQSPPHSLARQFFFSLGKYLFQFFESVLPVAFLILFLLLIVIYAFWRKDLPAEIASAKNNLFLLPIFIGTAFIILSLFMPIPFFRYLAPLLPVCCILMALVVESYLKLHIAAGICAFLIFAYLQPLPDYLYEITHDYDGPIKGISNYLNRNGKETDLVAITSGDLSLKFYTSMRVLGGSTGEDLSPARYADWVIIRKHVFRDEDWKVRQYLIENVPWQHYDRITLDSPDTPFENREDPKLHYYRTAKNEDRVVIFRKSK